MPTRPMFDQNRWELTSLPTIQFQTSPGTNPVSTNDRPETPPLAWSQLPSSVEVLKADSPVGTSRVVSRMLGTRRTSGSPLT